MRDLSSSPLLDAALAPPRRNGELAFDALWQSRIFGLTMTLYEAGAFHWDEFKDRLIASIATKQPALGYWECWLAAFELLLHDKGLCDSSVLEARVARLTTRPIGHTCRYGHAPGSRSQSVSTLQAKPRLPI